MTAEEDLQRMLGEPKAAIRNMILPFLIALAVVEVNQFVDTFGYPDSERHPLPRYLPSYLSTV